MDTLKKKSFAQPSLELLILKCRNIYYSLFIHDTNHWHFKKFLSKWKHRDVSIFNS